MSENLNQEQQEQIDSKIVSTKQEQIVVGEKVDDNAAMSSMWNLNNAIIQEINNVNKIYASKHGMFASVPIICKAQDCVFKDTCIINPSLRIYGQRCPAEISAIITRYSYWCAHFDIDITEDVIEDKNLVDASLIRDLINIEVQMMRAENKVAMSGDFMAKVLLDIDKKCKPYWGEDISPESNFLLSLQDKKIKILNQLNSTRKDKAADKNHASNPSEAAIKIFQEMQNAIKEKNIIDIDEMEFSEYKEVEDLPEDDTHVTSVIGPSSIQEDFEM